MEPAPDDATKQVVGARWWVPWVTGLFASGFALIALSWYFPIAGFILPAYVSTLVPARQRGGRASARAQWTFVGFCVTLFPGLGLFLGAIGLSVNHRDNAVLGAVIGGVLLAVAICALVAIALVARRRRTRIGQPDT